MIGRSIVAVCAMAVGMLAACDGSPGTPPPNPAVPVYPYVEMASEKPQDLAALRHDARTDGLTVSFVVAGNGCRPVWSRGERDVTDPAVASRIAAMRSAGGPVRIAFGGAGGTDVATACRTVEELAAAYRTVVDAYRPSVVDLDVEGRKLTDRPANERRVAAIRSVQRAAADAGHPFQVVYTLPAGPDGVPREGVRLLTDSVAAGVTISQVNVMVMNYGWGVTDQGDEALRQARLAHDLVRRLWPDLSGSEAWQRVALTAMIGVNDVPGEVFKPDDAHQVVTFAAERRVGWLSYWSVERDRQCQKGVAEHPSWQCSGIGQRPYQFAGIFNDRST